MFQDNTVNHTLIGLMRESNWTMRGIASVVILTFGSLMTLPAEAAIQQEIKQIQWRKADATNAAKLSAKIEETHLALTKLAAHDTKSLDVAASQSQVHALRVALEDLDKGATNDFAAVDNYIHTKKLSDVIEKRQQAAAITYRDRMDTLLAELKAVDSAKDVTSLMMHVNNAKAFLDKVQVTPLHENFDPKNLPFSVAKPIGKKPRLTKYDYEQRPVAPKKHAQVAANGSLAGILTAADVTGSLPTSPSDPSYVAATDDVQITPAIQAQAAALHNDPVQIYNWVHNNVEYVPTYGSIQGSDMTLQTLKGNDFDQASLLIALLRASNVPARYVYGTIQVPIVQVENWVGVTDPNAALNFMSEGGIPVSSVVLGGQIKYAQFEHVWVEAWVDFVPSRAARQGVGNTWAPMDASFKLHSYTQGMNLRQSVPINSQAFIQQATAGSVSSDANGSIQGINVNALQSGLSSYQAQLASYINSQNPNATNSDVLGGKSIIARNAPELSSSLANVVVAVGNRFAQIPSTLQYRIQFDFYANATSAGTGDPAFSVTKGLPTISESKIAIAFPAATSADQATLDSVNNGLATSLPAYLINVVPTLVVDGTTLGSGSAVTMGSQQTLSVTVISPSGQQAHEYILSAGDLGVLAVNAAGISQSVYQTRVSTHDLTQPTATDFVAESYYQIGLGWWTEKDTYNELYSREQGVAWAQLPSYTMVGTSLTVSYAFGIPQSAVYESRFVDAKQDSLMVQSATGDQTSAKNFVELVGETGSALESGIFDQMYVMDDGHSLSTMSILKIANDQNIPIYTITAQNLGTALPELNVDTQAISDIQNSVTAGLEVVIPGHDITVDNYTGTGYIIRDPVTGAGSYLISGGRDGGDSVAPNSTEPLPQLPATGTVTMLAGFAALSAPSMLSGISLSEVGTAVGGAVGGAVIGPAVISALATLITIIVILGIIATALNMLFPPTNENVRHYTRLYDPLNGRDIAHIEKFGSIGIIQASTGGIIFFAKSDEELLVDGALYPQDGFACPPTADQATAVVNSYNLSLNPGESKSQRVSAWVDLTFTREKWPPRIEVGNGQATEVEVAMPLMPYFKNIPVFGIQYDFTCFQ